MARKLKAHALSGRVDENEYAIVTDYVEAAEIGVADLVRVAVQEYITNHPITKE